MTALYWKPFDIEDRSSWPKREGCYFTIERNNVVNIRIWRSYKNLNDKKAHYSWSYDVTEELLYDGNKDIAAYAEMPEVDQFEFHKHNFEYKLAEMLVNEYERLHADSMRNFTLTTIFNGAVLLLKQEHEEFADELDSFRVDGFKKIYKLLENDAHVDDITAYIYKAIHNTDFYKDE